MKNKIKDLFDVKKYRERCNTYKVCYQTLLDEYTTKENENKKLENKIKELRKEIKELKKVK
jgi:hypothetical protein